MSRMELVRKGREWIIKTKEDYEKALEILDGNEFCANMCDDYSVTKRELAEIFEQRKVINAQAKALGII